MPVQLHAHFSFERRGRTHQICLSKHKWMDAVAAGNNQREDLQRLLSME
jgi:hypothetical protein